MKNAQKTFDLSHGNRGGGICVYARNQMQYGDYATLTLLSGITHLTDGLIINLKMYKDFQNPNAIRQVKEYLRGINPNIGFSDEDNTELKAKVYSDENLYTNIQVSRAIKSVESASERTLKENLEVLEWAIKKGFAVRLSYTQAHWTDAGVEWWRSFQSA